MLTDPIADMLTRIRNANTAMHDEVRMPASKQKVALATILEKEGYITGFAVAPSTTGPGDVLTTHCTYDNQTGHNVTFGESSDDEMCFSDLFYYPAQGANFVCSGF